jgi:hypothetical protein
MLCSLRMSLDSTSAGEILHFAEIGAKAIFYVVAAYVGYKGTSVPLKCKCRQKYLAFAGYFHDCGRTRLELETVGLVRYLGTIHLTTISPYVHRSICICTGNGVSAASCVVIRGCSLRRRAVHEEILVSRAVFRDGVRAACISRVAARCCSLSLVAPSEAVPPRISKYRREDHARTLERVARLAYLA